MANVPKSDKPSIIIIIINVPNVSELLMYGNFHEWLMYRKSVMLMND